MAQYQNNCNLTSICSKYLFKTCLLVGYIKIDFAPVHLSNAVPVFKGANAPINHNFFNPCLKRISFLMAKTDKKRKRGDTAKNGKMGRHSKKILQNQYLEGWACFAALKISLSLRTYCKTKRNCYKNVRECMKKSLLKIKARQTISNFSKIEHLLRFTLMLPLIAPPHRSSS